MNITQEQSKAAGEIVELIAKKFGENRQIHPGTAITSGARLAGSFMFRSFNFTLNDIKPGSAVLSEQANEKGPVLINILGGTLANFGVNVDPGKMKSSSKVESNVSFIDTLNNVQQEAHEIMTQNKLSHEQMAYSCAMATAFLIKECRNDLPVESGFNTAIYGLVEGSKTYPPALNESGSSKKSFFKFWK